MSLIIEKHPDLIWSCFRREDRPIVVDTTLVVENVAGELKKLIPTPNYLLPWERAWFEFILPYKIRNRVGVALMSASKEKYYEKISMKEYAITAHVIDAAFCISLHGNKPQWIGWATQFLEADGTSIRTDFGFKNQDTVTDREGRKIIHGTMLTIWMYVEAALVFLNCKNVVAENATLPKSKKRKTTIHDPDVVYKKLVVTLPGVRNAGLNVKRESNHSIRMHVCRGHFMDHRKNGLFGKDHLRGIYWVPMHAKGSKAAGEVVKNYELKVSYKTCKQSTSRV